MTASGLANKGLRARLTALGAVGLVVVVASAVLPWVEKGDENGANSLALVEQPVSLLLMMVAVGLWVAWLVGLVRDRAVPGLGLAGSVLATVTLGLFRSYVDMYDRGVFDPDASAEVRVGAHVALAGAVLLTATTAWHGAVFAWDRAEQTCGGARRSSEGPRVASLLGIVAVGAAFTLDWASRRVDPDPIFREVAPGRGGLLLHLVVAAVVAAMVLAVLWLVRSTRRWAPAAGLVGSVLGLTAVAALWIGIAAGDGAETKGEYGALLLWFGWCWVLACVGADAVSQALD